VASGVTRRSEKAGSGSSSDALPEQRDRRPLSADDVYSPGRSAHRTRAHRRAADGYISGRYAARLGRGQRRPSRIDLGGFEAPDPRCTIRRRSGRLEYSAAVAEEFLTVADIASRLKVNQQTVRNWIDRGQLAAVRVGSRRVRVRESDLADFLDASN
jgi:excisionase family DNA binding protein